MKYLLGISCLIIGVIAWFAPQGVPAYQSHSQEQRWLRAHAAALAASYEQEEAADIFQQPFKYRHYPTPLNLGYLHQQEKIQSWDEGDPLGLVLAFRHSMGQLQDPSDLAQMARFRSDGEAWVQEYQRRLAQGEHSLADDIRGNAERMKRWYAVADVLFPDARAGVLIVTYDADGQVQGTAMEHLHRVDGVYRYFPISDAEGMQLATQRERLVDYLGLKPDPPEDPNAVVYFADHLAERAATEEAQQHRQQWNQRLLWYLQIAGGLLVGLGGLIIAIPWRQTPRKG